jgi:RNA polymerase sigma-70 factor, ECF subfamily
MPGKNILDKILKNIQNSFTSSSQDKTDNELIEKFVKYKDEKSFEILVNRYVDRIYGLAFRITRDHHQSEEVLQEVQLTLIKKIDTFRGESKFSSWLYRVTANASFMIIRAERKYENELSLENYAPYDDKGTLMGKIHYKDWSSRPDIIIYVKEALEILEKAINELPDVYRIVFHLRDIEGFSNEEVSEILDLSIPAVKSRIHRARLYLRDKVSDYFYEWKK